MDHGDTTATLKRADPFDPAFIEHMIPHHEGAIRMSRALLPNTDDRELRDLAESIVSAQPREIEHTRALGEEHYGDASAPRAGHERQARTKMRTRAERPGG
jgi:uncharacterized protein (DUF305 family)